MCPHIQTVLKRDNIAFDFKQAEENKYTLLFDGSSRRFTEVLEDALCEKQRVENHSRIPVYSYRTLRNENKRQRLMKLNGRKGFVVINKDLDKVRRYCM